MNHASASRLINAITGLISVISLEAAAVTFNMHAVEHARALLPLCLGLAFGTILAIRLGVARHTRLSAEQAALRYQRTLNGASTRQRQAHTNEWLAQQARADRHARMNRAGALPR